MSQRDFWLGLLNAQIEGAAFACGLTALVLLVYWVVMR
jgi:hypothetical protein